jgi:hypothetical protein
MIFSVFVSAAIAFAGNGTELGISIQRPGTETKTFRLSVKGRSCAVWNGDRHADAAVHVCEEILTDVQAAMAKTSVFGAPGRDVPALEIELKDTAGRQVRRVELFPSGSCPRKGPCKPAPPHELRDAAVKALERFQ